MAKWIDKNGNELCPLKDMSERHAANVIKYLIERNSAKKALYLLLKGYNNLEERNSIVKKRIANIANCVEDYAAAMELNGDMAQQSILQNSLLDEF